MKKSIRFISLLLAAILAVSLSSCGFVNISFNTNPFTRGVVDGNVYMSTFSGITFEKPDAWVFYTDEEIADLTGASLELLDSDALEKAAEGEIIDFYAADDANGNGVNLSRTKGKIYTALQPSIDATIEQTKSIYESMGWTVSVSDQTSGRLGSVDVQKVTVTVTATGLNMMQYCYFTVIGQYFVAVTCTTTTGLTALDFEAMFS